jgi:drug/metabolite transporter (DMT)-like permease
MFLYEAYSRIGVSIATLAYYCGPVIVMVLSPILFGEKMSWVKIVGFLSVLAGMFCVNYRVLSHGGNAWGVLCAVMSAIMFALMVIFNKKAVSISGLENSMCQLCVSFMTVAIFLGLYQGFSFRLESGSIMPIIVLGILNTGVGCYLYFSSIGDLPVQTVAICGYLEPLSALLFSVIILGETLNSVQIAGTILILCGSAFGELFSPKKFKAFETSTDQAVSDPSRMA